MANEKNTESTESSKGSFLTSLFYDFLIYPKIETSLTYLNIVYFFFFGLIVLSGKEFHYWYFLTILPAAFMLFIVRRSVTENQRYQISHRIPYFAESLANTLSIGMTLEQALEESISCLQGSIKTDFNELIVKHTFGKDLGILLNNIDKKYPNTGLRYLISLLEQYRILGVGISPLLKRMSQALIIKNEAEDKIRATLMAGASYARLSIGVFIMIFFVFSFMLKDQIKILMSPELFNVFVFLLVWSGIGIIFVTKLSSINYARNSALKPYIKSFYEQKEFTEKELITYSGIDWDWKIKLLYEFSPLLLGFIILYCISWYTNDELKLIAAFGLGTIAGMFINKSFLTSIVEEQLVKTVEVIPDFLQVFIIGLNSGLNRYLALEFAIDAIRGTAPRLFLLELYRTKFAMECGESPGRSWQLFAKKLPFEVIYDFAEVMITAPMHGDSIVGTLIQMSNSYQIKKMSLIEKKATSLGQMVVPIIVISLFPLFLFAIFGPLVKQLTSILKM